MLVLQVITDMIDSKFNFDRLKMYFGEPFELPNGMVILQPTIGDILNVGEAPFYGNLNIFVGNPTMYRLKLWEAGVDWNKISDFDLFTLLIKTCEIEYTQLLFDGIDFRNFERVDLDENTAILMNEKDKLIITKEHYELMAKYIRTMFNIFPKVEKAKGKTTKEWMIQEEKDKLLKSSNEDVASTLLPLISACVNHPGFKYKLQELKEVGIVQFMDSVQRIQVYETAIALNHGAYSGMCDMSKVDKSLLNFMRDIG